ncbi:MmgE/PrpD family protein [Brucella haematophila]|uniref:MmgE/PrpD family protein n=1 Tax=Brucella haematophila TaxID=419474 RepID=A0ABX1DTQ0_9HYPH|nr:MmgE/PrpD family protein [Brucella haematophila]NKC04942.1 MmgE/PrpD family protein [Brucella haematophila]TMV04534.1 MmgE/PrpD family protein [Brucella haematophila]
MTDHSQTLEEAVAAFVVNFTHADIDARTLEAAKALIKDQFAIQIGASVLPWSQKTLAFRAPHPGRATIVNRAEPASAVDAAYMNATYGHGFEYDDFFGNAHPGCAVVPAAFALGEELGASLEEVLTALVVGYETYVRIGKWGSPAVLNVGWQPHAIFANFGTAALAAKLMKLDVEQTFHALAIALSHASGPTEYASTGGSIKRVHAGIAVRNGIEAAGLAAAGVTGPRRFLTGDRGLYRMFCHKTVGDEAIADFLPGVANFMPGLSFKHYCCCACTFSYIEAMQELQGRAQDIERVEARVQTMVNNIVGTRNANIYQPRNIEEVQYSLPAQMAMSALGIGNGFSAHHAVLEGKIDLKDGSPVYDLINRIKIEISPELDEKYRHFVADVTVHLKDGTTETIFREQSKGSPMKPYTAAEHLEKLSDLTDGVMGREQAARLWALVDEMRFDRKASEIASLLVPGR